MVADRARRGDAQDGPLREEATEAPFDAAAGLFERVANEEGLGQVLHLAGTIAAQRGDYDAARERYETSLAIRERLGDTPSMGGLLSNLGVVGEYDGDYEASRDFHERSLALRRELGDRWAIAVSLTNLGMIAVLQEQYDEARDHFEESMRLNREVGDSWMVAISHNNLGNAFRGPPVTSRPRGATTARAACGPTSALRGQVGARLSARGHRSRWPLSSGEHERALALVGAADRMREEIGSPRGPTLDTELDAAALQSQRIEALGDEAAETVRTRGASMELLAEAARGSGDGSCGR